MVDAEVQTEPNLPATVVGVEQDILIGVRVRKSFGSRTFWGSVVGCYWVSGGLFYKVSFDDGDVDVFSADEVLQDAAAAKERAKENPQSAEKAPAPANQTAMDDYFTAMRHNSLKRKRDDVVDATALRMRRVHLWGQRLYASIYTNEQNETFIKELLKTDDGRTGEMEATGQVKVGDMILAVNQTRVLGMTSRELAELIRKPKRPITLTFYRPQQSQISTQQQQAPTGQVQAPAASSAPTTTTAQQTQQIPQPPTQHAAPIPRQQVQQQPAASAPVVMPPSFAVPQPTFAHPASMAQNIAHQWTQPTSMSQPHGLSTKEIIRQRLSQNAAARQASYMPGYPTGMFVRGNVVPVPSTQGGAYQNHQMQYMQRVANAAAMRVASGFSVPAAQHARPMYQPQTSAPRARFEYNQERNQRQRTGPMPYEQVQQVQTQRSAIPGPIARTNGAQESRFSILSQVEPGQRVTSSQSERTHQEASASATSQQPPNQESTSDRRSADNIPRESPTSTSTPVSSTPTTGTSMLIARDVEAIARLAEKDPEPAERAMRGSTRTNSLLSPNDALADEEMEDATSFLSPSASADKETTTIKRETESSSRAMSFLSPNDFNMESSMLSHRDLSAGTAANKAAEVNSNVSLVVVRVSRRRLYLTLGVQGTLIAVTSFVRDEFGRPGEVEASGKVFLGDVLARINETYIVPGLTPSHVADIVNSSPRPMTLWFERASWDILDGKA